MHGSLPERYRYHEGDGVASTDKAAREQRSCQPIEPAVGGDRRSSSDRSGHFKNVPELAETLANDAPGAIQWLESLGCNFSKYPDGTLKTIHGGGTSRKRMHYAADITGAEIMRTLHDEARNCPGKITLMEFSPAIELILNEHGHCAGAILFNLETEEYLVVKAKAVIMATGGGGRLHIQGFMTTNHYGATGDGIVIAYRAGVPIYFLHTVQYHPTGVVFPEQAEGILITEKFRGSGANLLDIMVFGRISGRSAAAYVKDNAKDGKLTLDHATAYNKEVADADVADGRVAPMVLPDYTDARVREKQLTANYVGTLR